MFEPNSLMYQTNHQKNWSREQQELNGYLAKEWRYRTGNAKSAREFCTGGSLPTRERRSRPAAPERRPHAWHVPTHVASVLALLHLRRSR